LKYLKRCERIIAISEDTKKDIVRLLGVGPKKIDVIYLGVDRSFYKPKPKLRSRKKLNLPLNKKLILNFGSDTDYRKNVETVIKSFYEIQKKEPDSVLVRIGKVDKKITKLVKKLGIERKIIRINRVSESGMPYYYSAADVYLCLDIETGFGLPILESMSCGTPVVCSNTGAFPEVVGSSGFLVNPMNANEVAKDVLKIFSNKKLTGRMISGGLKRVKQFSWKKMADETLKVYKKVIKETIRH
jgi:glycosyltransferase involved in cell wall biosynthesis